MKYDEQTVVVSSLLERELVKFFLVAEAAESTHMRWRGERDAESRIYWWKTGKVGTINHSSLNSERVWLHRELRRQQSTI